MENGLKPNDNFLALINKAAWENKDASKLIPPREDYLIVNITLLYIAVIKYFIEKLYLKVR